MQGEKGTEQKHVTGKGTISKGKQSSNHHFSGDMLVFRGEQKMEPSCKPTWRDGKSPFLTCRRYIFKW